MPETNLEIATKEPVAVTIGATEPATAATLQSLGTPMP